MSGSIKMGRRYEISGLVEGQSKDSSYDLGKMHSFDGRRGCHRREKPETALSGVFKERVGLGEGKLLHNDMILS